MRKVILHYHLFKNAGTSVDAAFKENLAPEEWVTAEFPGQPKANREQVAQWILDNPHAKVFSSHTAYLPPPKLKGIKVLPVIFLRHPIDRIASAYAFEAKQEGKSFGAVLARNTDLRGYVETRLALPNDRQCRNFQVHRLAMMVQSSNASEFERAKQSIITLPFVGIVEKYENSLRKLEECLQDNGLDGIRLRPVKKNVSRANQLSLCQKIKIIENQLGGDLFNKLLSANEEDCALWREAKGD